ncbi:MAG TPA: hypothetical protein VKF59_14855 [Candidatus Dormibacteraeota bacterium]|nr:hypothetical protein [Candidatus Dormibacteraeota bacterium]
MPPALRRHVVVCLLILGAAAAGAGLQLGARPDPPLPAVPPLADAGSWQVETAYEPGSAGMAYRQWLLRDSAGARALLFLGVTSQAKTVVRWSGELGYQGEGYLVTSRSERTVRLANDRTALVSDVLVQRLVDRQLLVYGVLGPAGVAPSGTARLPQTAWDAVRGHGGPYYLVRVAEGANDSTAGAWSSASRLLAAVLSALLHQSG